MQIISQKKMIRWLKQKKKTPILLLRKMAARGKNVALILFGRPVLQTTCIFA